MGLRIIQIIRLLGRIVTQRAGVSGGMKCSVHDPDSRHYVFESWLGLPKSHLKENILICCSNIFWNHTNGRVLNDELYTRSIQRLIFLHLFAELFCK